MRRVSAGGDEMQGHATRRQVIAGVLAPRGVRAGTDAGRTWAAESHGRCLIFCTRNRMDPISGFAKNGETRRRRIQSLLRGPGLRQAVNDSTPIPCGPLSFLAGANTPVPERPRFPVAPLSCHVFAVRDSVPPTEGVGSLLKRHQVSKIRESRPVFRTPCKACAPSPYHAASLRDIHAAP